MEKCSALQITHLVFQLGYERVFHLTLLLKLRYLLLLIVVNLFLLFGGLLQSQLPGRLLHLMILVGFKRGVQFRVQRIALLLELFICFGQLIYLSFILSDLLLQTF